MSKVSLFEDDVVVAAATNVNQDSDTDFRYSGRLGTTALFIQDLSTENISWISVATRDFDVIVTLSYAGPPGGVIYTVKAGCPLLVTNEAGGSPFVGVTIASANSSEAADVELHVYEGDQPFAPPDPAFLILNASTGITTDTGVPGSVTKWTDTRPTTLAPDDFSWGAATNTSPLLIESDPDFNGQPSVDFTDSSSSSYIYDTTASTIFNFMRDTPFTVAAVIKAPDGPYTGNLAAGAFGQGIWNTNNASSGKNGFRALLEGGNRLEVSQMLDTMHTPLSTGVDEIINKSMVVIWKFGSGLMQLYWQGRWQPAFGASLDATNDTSPFEVGNAETSSGLAQLFLGKIADIRVYDFEWSEEESDAYIATAVSVYGVDDTQGITMPFVSSCNGFWRASRGVNVSTVPPFEGLVNFWSDTRREAIATAQIYLAPSPGTNPSVTAADPLLGNEQTLAFDGVAQTLSNGYAGTTGNFLSGDSPGFSLLFVYYEKGILGSARALMAMAAYNSGSLDGVSIFYKGSSATNNSLTYELDNGVGADVVNEEGSIETGGTPRAVSFRVDGGSWWIDEKNLDTGVVTSSNGTFGGTPSATTSVPVFLFSFPDASGFMIGALGEHVTDNSKKTDAEVLEYFDYVTSRYGS